MPAGRLRHGIDEARQLLAARGGAGGLFGLATKQRAYSGVMAASIASRSWA